MAEPARPEVRYTAFLSYSHKDAAAAGRLHRRLESYRLPKRLAGTESARGIVPERLWPIFRDREELPAATDLSETVREALAQSGSLIVLCSPHSAGSLWVAEEIETFRRLHPDRPILAAVLDGDPPDCFPAALRAFGQDGSWHEPLATDLRRGRDGAHLGLLKLVAGITGVGLDALVQRDAARKVRRVTAVTAVAVIAMLIMAALAWFALDARREAERQRAEAEGQIEFMLTDLREKLRGVGRLDIMGEVNLHALAYYDRQLSRHDGRANSAMRARVLHAIGEDLIVRNDGRGARIALEQAFDVTSALMGRSPDEAENIFAHGQSEYWLGYLAYMEGDAIRVRRHWQTYRQLVGRLEAIEPANLIYIREMGYAEGNLCTLALREPADVAAAARHCRSALAQMERVYRRRGADPLAVEDLVNRHAWSADAAVVSGDWPAALRHRSEQERLLKSLIAREPANFDYRDLLMRMQFTFAGLLANQGRMPEARAWAERAAVTARELADRDSENANWLEWRQKTENRRLAYSSR